MNAARGPVAALAGHQGRGWRRPERCRTAIRTAGRMTRVDALRPWGRGTAGTSAAGWGSGGGVGRLGGGLGGAAATLAAQGPPLVLAHPAEDSVLRQLRVLHRPGAALLQHRAPGTDRLGLVELQHGRSGVPDREEQFRILVEAGGAIAPVTGRGLGPR